MGLIDNEIVYGSISSKDFNVFCSGAGSYTSPQRKYKKTDIAGRNGTLYRDLDSFNNVDVEYKCIINGDLADFERFKAFLNAQSGYKRLEDSFHPDEYRMGVVKPIDPKVKYEDGVAFDLEFNCMPQRFLKEGEKTYHITQSGQLVNNTYFTAKPLVRVYDNGFITFNGKTLNISNISGYMDIDSELMDCYKGDTNLNANVSGEFPVLVAGVNTITCTGTIDIIPRWWTL